MPYRPVPKVWNASDMNSVVSQFEFMVAVEELAAQNYVLAPIPPSQEISTV